ncbi:hypothetical protein ACTWQF_35630 [Streptomyces sp. 8N114]|uniref:hypothetical protein n=1 Tax=Streptomyces sp. 8N114 TaxID=3457419 RepID=UPI003FCFA2C9
MHHLEEQAAHLAEELMAAERLRDQAAVTAGDPARHDEVLARWQESGGDTETVLARARTSAEEDAQAATAEARQMRERAEQLRDRAIELRREVGIRATLPDARRAAEHAARAQQSERPQPPSVPPVVPPQRDGSSRGPRRGM